MMNAVLNRYGKWNSARLVSVVLLGLFGATISGLAFAKHDVHTVVIEGMRFVPDRLEVKAGDTVVWQNKDIVTHNATTDMVPTHGGFESPTLASKQSWKHRVRKKGEFPYRCTLHPTMRATLIVK